MAQVVSFRSFIARKKELKGARCIGFDYEDNPIWVDVGSPMTLEEYILKNVRVSRLNKWITRRLGSQLFMGMYREPNEPIFSKYYLFWCFSHQIYYVSILKGEFHGSGKCPRCSEEKGESDD